MPSEDALKMMQAIADSPMQLTEKIECHLRIFFPKFAATGSWHAAIMTMVVGLEMGRDLNQEIPLPGFGKLLNKENPTFHDILEFFQITHYLAKESF